MSLELFYSFAPGWLLDVTLQTTVLLTLAGGVTLCVRRMAAARRHFILASALMLIPVVMVCSFVAPAWRMELPLSLPLPWGDRRAADAEVAGGLETTVMLDYRQVPPKIESVVSVTTPRVAAKTSPLWAVLWLAGIGAGAVVLGFSAWTLRRLRAGSLMVVDAAMQCCFVEEAGALQLVLPGSCLRMSAACAVPMTWGISKRTVLLPEQAAGWEEARLRLVLRHELAHIARGDVLITLLTTVAALLLWFQPLVWLMLRASARVREQACDDIALERSGLSPDDFADELLAAVAGLGSTVRPWLPLALAVSASARAMRGRLSSLVQAGRGRGGYTVVQKLVLLVPAVVGAFGLAGLSACRKAEPVVPRQILVMSRFVSIPKDSPVLAEAGLTLDASNPNLQNLGILNGAQTQALLRKLSQQKGVHLMSAPSVTTRSGQKATMEVMREFIYPTEFDPPKQATDDQPVIPTTPKAFEMRPVGIRMEVVPTFTYKDEMNITVTPEVTSFEGFIDYGSPITHAGKVVSENAIKQPVFHTMKTTAGFHLKSGQSVVFGGLGSPDSSPLTSHMKGYNNVVFGSPGSTPLINGMPPTKNLIFFIIQANVVEEGKATAARKETAAAQPAEPTVSIIGQVKRQGLYVLKPGMTAQDLIDQAQGLSDRADATRAELKRGPRLARRTLALDLSNESAKPLKDGDALTVPKK
jgi:beta-lactamase regulating signal transducer with metallopeptidase domain